MGEVKHTPGPWEAVRINDRGQNAPDGKCWWVYAGNGNGWVGESYMSACLGLENGAEANARLIAAAPDLLEALLILMPRRVCLTNANVPDSMVIPCDVTVGELRAASAAIARATQSPATEGGESS